MRACDDLVYAAVLSAARAEQRLVDDADDRAGFREVVGAQVGSHAEALAACVAGEANEAVLDVPLQRDVARNACGNDEARADAHRERCVGDLEWLMLHDAAGIDDVDLIVGGES